MTASSEAEQPIQEGGANEDTGTLLAAQPEGSAQDTGDVSSTTDEQTTAPEGAPEAYAFEAPEGATIDEQVISSFEEWARKANMTQENAQGMLSEVYGVMQARDNARIEAAQEEMVKSTKLDTEVGGVHLDGALDGARKVLAAVNAPEFVKLLETTRLGNHVEVIRVFHRLSKMISEDRLAGEAQGDAPGERNPAKVLFPDHN